MLVSQVWWIVGLTIEFDIDYAAGFEANFRELEGAPPSVEQQLGAVGLNEFRDSIVTHIVSRATFLPGTERCTSSDPFREAPYDEFFSIDPLPTFSFSAIQCFADVRVNSYILGKGPPRLTVQTGSYIYPLEELKSPAGSVEREEAPTEEEFIESLRSFWESSIVFGDLERDGVTRTGGVRGKEVVLFLGPSINHATEAWQVFETWDVKLKNDGTVVAVHPHREAWLMSYNYSSTVHGPLLEMELSALEQAVTAANEARVSEYGGRIGADPSLPLLLTDAHDLRQYYTAVGAYDHPDGTPVPPPPVYGEDSTATPEAAP